MNKSTPARLISERHRKANATAFGRLIAKLEPSPPRTVLDVRYGLGGWAKVLNNHFPGVAIKGYEADSETASNAWKSSGVELITRKFYPEEERRKRFDLVCGDFNTLTAKKRVELDELLGSLETDWLIFTDVACCKLHLNYFSYGLDKPDLKKYWRSFVVEGFSLMTFEREHYFASTALYKTKEPR